MFFAALFAMYFTIRSVDKSQGLPWPGADLDLTLGTINTTVLVADISMFAEVNEIFAETFPTDPPARMTMQVPLPLGLLISVGCVAIVYSA